MPEPDYRGLLDAGRLAQQPGFDTVRQRAARLRTRQRVALTGGALALAVLLGGTGFAVARTPSDGLPPAEVVPSPTVSEPTPESSDVAPRWAHVRWAGAGDRQHLYVLRADCDGCQLSLLASADGGATWQNRRIGSTPARKSATFARDMDFLAASGGFRVVGPTTLIRRDTPKRGGPSLTQPRPADPDGVAWSEISGDGGASWRSIDVAKTTVPQADPGAGAIDCGRTVERCPLYAFDATTGRIAPLATQPALTRVELVATPAGAGFWVSGLDPATRRPAVAVSRDRGASWATTVFTEENAVADQHGSFGGDLVTVDGQTVHAMFFHARIEPEKDELRLYVSHDGGQSFEWINRGQPLPTAPLMTPRLFVTADGTYAVLANDGAGYHYQATRDGRRWTRLATTGLTGITERWPQIIEPGWYLATGTTRIHLSTDGLNWRPVAVPQG